MEEAVLSALVLGLLAGYASQVPSSSEIVVSASRPLASRRLLGTVMRSIARPADTGGNDFQMARWIDPVCPVVVGIGPEEATALETKIRRVAADAGAPVGGANCARNIQVVVISNPRAALLNVKSREPAFLSGVPRRDVAAMIDSNAAVRWGSATITYSADGRPMEAGGVVRNVGASRLSAGVQTGLGHMIVIVDRDQVASMPIGSWQSCVALVALAQFRPHTLEAGPATALTAADDASSTVDDLTPFDRAYLRALYTSGAALHGGAQQLYMTRRVAKMLSTGDRR